MRRVAGARFTPMFRCTGFVRFLSFALLAFSLVLSSAAWAGHSATHGAGLVTAGATQGHADVPAHNHGSTPGQDKQDGGHDHLLSLFFPVAALFGGTLLQPPPLPAAQTSPIAVPTLKLRAGDPPPADPPRHA